MSIFSRLKKKIKLPKPNPTLKHISKKVFGFEDTKKEKYLKSVLDEVEVAIELATIKNDLNWIKRILWLMGCVAAAGIYFT